MSLPAVIVTGSALASEPVKVNTADEAPPVTGSVYVVFASELSIVITLFTFVSEIPEPAARVIVSKLKSEPLSRSSTLVAL